MPNKAATLLPALAMCAALSAACTAPATAPPTETLPTATPAPVATATPKPTSTPPPTDTATPVPTPTFEPRTRYKVQFDCRQDKGAEKFLIEIAEGTTVGDLAADPAIADCYGHTIPEKSQNIGNALKAQDGLVTDTTGEWSQHKVQVGVYELFLNTATVPASQDTEARLRLVTPTTPPPTLTPTPPRRANFIHPVDLAVAPMYDAYDLDRTEGVIESNAGPAYSFHGGCSGNWMVPHTIDNHPGYDYGSGGCGADVSGTPVNGMNTATSGRVISTSDDGLWIDQGVVLLTNGDPARIVLKYGHITPFLSVGDYADYTTTVGELNEEHHEVEVQVCAADPDETASLSGEALKRYLCNRHPAIDPRLIGLEPFPQP